jgi:hypothetical protein
MGLFVFIVAQLVIELLDKVLNIVLEAEGGVDKKIGNALKRILEK